MTTDVAMQTMLVDEEPVGWLNYSGLENPEVYGKAREVAGQLVSWLQESRAVRGRNSLFDRRAYISPEEPLAQMAVARRAVADDDVVGGAADVTEGLMFQGMKMESEEADEADVFNQWAAKVNMDDFLRSAYRELFTCSQLVCASWWAWQTFRVRGYDPPPEQKLVKIVDPETGLASYEPERDPETNQPKKPARRGRRRRKEFRLWMPTRLTLLDSSRVIPVGNRFWGEDRLAWHATEEEVNTWDGAVDGVVNDATMASLVIGRYRPGADEKLALQKMGVNPDRLLELNPLRVWRHTRTRASSERWAQVRLKSCFRLLDLKAQLMEADRVMLVGAANYILLIKKGSKEQPGLQTEVDSLKDNFDVVAKLPVIISDHRLEIEIITPKVDLTLVGEKYDTIDRRIVNRLLGSLTVSSSGQRNESTITTAKMVGRLLESQRHMLKRAVEAKVLGQVDEMNPGALEDLPSIAFVPNRIELETDDQVLMAVTAARTRNELSRESFLEYLGFDQAIELQRRIEEEVSGADAVFMTHTPFDSPMNNTGGLPTGAFGSTGGRPTGGGTKTKNAAAPAKGKS